MAEIKNYKRKSSSSSSESSSSNDQQPKYYQSQAVVYQPTQQNVIYQSGIVQPGFVQTSSQFSSLPAGVTEEQVRRSLAGVSLDVIKGEVRQEYIPLTRVETEYKEEVQYEKVPRQVKVTDYYQVEIQEEKIPQVYQHTYTEYIPQQKIIPIVSYRAMEKTYTRPEIMAGDVRVEQGQAEIVSTQIIQGETQNIAAVPLPQIGISGYEQPVQYSQQRSFVAAPQIIQSSYQTVQQPQIYQQQVQVAAPSFTYQTSVLPQQRIMQQPGMIVGRQSHIGYNNNFQGVRLTDSHILMK